MKENWIIGICSSAEDGVILMRVCGTKDQVKQYLVDLVAEDKAKDEGLYEGGIDDVEDVKDDGYELYAYGVYSTYHIDYTACLEDTLMTTELEGE